MRYQDIALGKEYGVRLTISPGRPLLHVRVLQKVDRTKQVQVEHLDGEHQGMTEFLTFRHVVVPWSEQRRFLQEEEAFRRVREASSDADPVYRDAVQIALEASGETTLFVHGDGHLSADPVHLLRVAARANLPTSLKALDSLAFVDSLGRARMTFGAAERLARAFAAKEPDSITMALAVTEKEYEASGYAPGEHWQHDQLRKLRPVHALIRQWAGGDSEAIRLADEVERLQGLVRLAIGYLTAAGLAREAARLRRALDGR